MLLGFQSCTVFPLFMLLLASVITGGCELAGFREQFSSSAAHDTHNSNAFPLYLWSALSFPIFLHPAFHLIFTPSITIHLSLDSGHHGRVAPMKAFSSETTLVWLCPKRASSEPGVLPVWEVSPASTPKGGKAGRGRTLTSGTLESRSPLRTTEAGFVGELWGTL